MTKTAAEMVAEAVAAVEGIAPKDAYDQVAAGRATLLDVREPVEWEHHIDGAVEVPRGLLEFAADPQSPRHNTELDPARRVIVYCRSGTRAALGGEHAADVGLRERRKSRRRVRGLEGSRAANRRAPRGHLVPGHKGW